MKPENINRANELTHALKLLRKDIQALENESTRIDFEFGDCEICAEKWHNNNRWTSVVKVDGIIVQQLKLVSEMTRQNLLAICKKAETDILKEMEVL